MSSYADEPLPPPTTLEDDETDFFRLQSDRVRREFIKWVEFMNDHGITREEAVAPAAVEASLRVWEQCQKPIAKL